MHKTGVFYLQLIVVAAIGMLLTGCSGGMQLHYGKPSIGQMDKGSIHVVIDDQRTPDRGGNNPMRVGTIRNSVGMPFALKARKTREPSTVVKQLVTDCLQSAGYSTIAGSGSGGHLNVILQDFWSDGYQHSRAWIHIKVQLREDPQAPVVWEHTFQSNQGLNWTVGYGPFNKAINKMLEDIKTQMISEFQDSKFDNAFKGFNL